ncbi:hypothetical protein F4781DRAFT_412495 [Annulohypoxylon bovei var. microspora]|nr:hypothetical protein F4781DRAFT_412495 [Annulohypoxylon bovei var. microspora]
MMMTNLGPLTTTFTPAPECTAVISGIVFTQTGTDGNTTTHKYHSLGPSDTSSCYPPAFQTTSGFFSPGICPSGWSSACGSVDVIGGSITETTATCCPLGYKCIQVPDVTETWSTLSCSSSAISTLNVTVPDVSNQYSKVTQLSGIIINAAAVTVRWQQSDFVASETSTSTTTSLSSSTLRISTAADSSPTNGGDNGDTGLSSNARIGIGIGTGLGSFGLILVGSVIGTWFWWRRRKMKRKPNDTMAEVTNPEAARLPTELWEQYQQEMPTSSNTHEMVTENNRHELSDTPRLAELPAQRWSWVQGINK